MRTILRRPAMCASFAALCLTLVACGPGALRDLIDATATVYLTPPTVAVTPVSGTEIRTDDVITVAFSSPIEAATLVLGGDMAAESDGGAWTTAVEGDDVLTVSPSDLWTIADHTLVVDCVDYHGNTVDTISLSFVVLEGIWCVSPSGDDGGPGTRQAPMASIPAAIAAADQAAGAGSYDTVEVHVAAGTYTASSSDGTMIIMAEGVSVLGGYTADFSGRDIAANETILSDPAVGGGGVWATSNRAIYFDIMVTPATVLEGFTILGGAGLSSMAIACDYGSPTIRGNHIVQGAASVFAYAVGLSASAAVLDGNVVDGTVWASSGSAPALTGNTITTMDGPVTPYGVYLYEATGTIENNDITLGNSGEGGGIYVEANTGDLFIRGNRIDAGTSSGSNRYCVVVQAATPIVSGNTLNGGTGGIPTVIQVNAGSPRVYNNLILVGTPDAASTTIGLHLDASNAEIYNNTIVVPDSANAYGIQMTGGSAPVVDNNIVVLLGASAVVCIDETGNGTGAEVRKNSLWRSAGTALYTDTTGFAYDGLDDLHLAYSSRMSGNVNEDPVFSDMDGADNDLSTMSDNNWKLTVDTDALVRTGGLDGGALGWGFATDLAGKARTGNGSTGWSMGAFEW